MTELQELRRFLRVVYLRKSLYYSILVLLFSFITTVSLAVVNHYYIPELATVRKIAGILLFIASSAFLFWPIRYIIKAITFKFYSLNKLGRELKQFDEGRLNETTGLSKKELDHWAQNVVLKKTHLRIPEFKNHLNTKLPVSLITGVFIILLITLISSPKSILNESKDELIKGTFTRETQELGIKDTVRAAFNTVFEINHPVLKGFHNNASKPEMLIKRNETIDWELNGRLYKTQTIICDSIPKLTSWRAFISPPDYLRLSSYSTQDTIKAFPKSEITITYQGVLIEKIKVNVSRETDSNTFIWDGGDIALRSSYWEIKLPTILLNDTPPLIKVLKNDRDSISIVMSDDYGLKQVNIDSRVVPMDGLRRTINIAWENQSIIRIGVKDNNNNTTLREINKPRLNAAQLTNTASEKALKSIITENKELVITQYREQKESELRELTNSEVKKRDKETNKQKNDTPESLKDLLKRLDELWRMEEAVELLSRVDTNSNTALDSAINKAADALLELELNKAEEPVELMKNMEEQGEQRKQQAKEASDKLKQLLANSISEVQEDNVARIKRLLKDSWMVSVFQEDLRSLALSVNKARAQQLVLTNERTINDSLDLLLVHEPMLSQVLAEKRTNLDAAMRAIEAKIANGKSLDSDVGYAITALNDINQTLYFLLESEKKSLNQAKKNCKKGKPGSSGKPATSGKGKEGKKGTPNPSKKPGGREKGKSGDLKKGETGTKPGTSGLPGEKELLKRIELAKESLKTGGETRGKMLDELEQIKQELLFNSKTTEEALNRLEERLWQVEESVFNKDEYGEKRASESGEAPGLKEGESIDFKVLKSKMTDLPLPVLKKL